MEAAQLLDICLAAWQNFVDGPPGTCNVSAGNFTTNTWITRPLQSDFMPRRQVFQKMKYYESKIFMHEPVITEKTPNSIKLIPTSPVKILEIRIKDTNFIVNSRRRTMIKVIYEEFLLYFRKLLRFCFSHIVFLSILSFIIAGYFWIRYELSDIVMTSIVSETELSRPSLEGAGRGDNLRRNPRHHHRCHRPTDLRTQPIEGCRYPLRGYRRTP